MEGWQDRIKGGGRRRLWCGMLFTIGEKRQFTSLSPSCVCKTVSSDACQQCFGSSFDKFMSCVAHIEAHIEHTQYLHVLFFDECLLNIGKGDVHCKQRFCVCMGLHNFYVERKPETRLE